MKKLILAILIGQAACTAGTGQSAIGLPAIKNYRNTDYHAAIEVWDIAQDKNDLLYFANNDGLLTFDGAYWKTYPLPNKATIKSLAIDPSGKIYVGGQDEVGYFSPGSNGILSYHSLKEKLPKVAQQFADIWSIVIMKDEVFFRTIESIFQLKNNEMHTFDAPGGWRLMTLADSRLFAEDKTKGLLVFKDGQWVEACGKKPDAPLRITGILEYKKDTLLVTTLKHGLYLLTGNNLIPKATPGDPLLKNDLINNAKKIGEDRYAIGTAAGGLLIIDSNGSPIQRFSSVEGLGNNNVLRVFTDNASNLWLGLENGIAIIHYNSPVKHIYPVKGNQLKSNAVRIFDGKLFVGTSNGLYSVPLDPSQKDVSTVKGNFTEVTNTKGQVWSLEEINHELLEGHRDGAFVIRNNDAIPISTGQGVWGFKSLSSAGGAIIAGTYTGLRRIGYEKGRLKEGPKVNDLYESLPVIAVDDSNTVWASQPYRGVFSNPVPADPAAATHFTHYTRQQGLSSDLNNSVQIIDQKVIVATEKGVYEYQPASDRFVPSAFFNPIFQDTAVEYLKEDRDHNIWFVSNGRVGVIDRGKPSGSRPYSIIYFPELTSQTIKGAAYIYPYDKENIFIGSNNGVFHLNYSQYITSARELKVVLGSVKAIAEKDSLIFGGYDDSAQKPVRQSNHWNSFHFEYASPFYAQPSNVEFSHQLAGFDKDWSEWSGRTEKDYTNLPYGKYTFSVRARDNLGNISQQASFTFIVDPAWYQTIWAYLLYLAIFILIGYLLLKFQQQRLALHRKQYEEEQERLKYLHSLELDRKAKGLIALQNAKLEGELQFKNKELATVTMHLVERGSLLSNIKDELLAVIKKLNIPGLPYEFRSVFKMISDTEKNDDDWNRFALYFDQVHNNFLSILKAKFPLLSSTDLKLCAYLRLNLTSKEIAQILNISLKGVEVSRYRIRKKLNLPTETNLYDFLLEITTHQ